MIEVYLKNGANEISKEKITNREFFEGIMEKEFYFCKRLGVLFIGKRIVEARTPKDELHRNVFVDPLKVERFDTRCYEVDGKYYKIGHPAISENQILSAEKIKRLIPIDDYYNNQFQDTLENVAKILALRSWELWAETNSIAERTR